MNSLRKKIKLAGIVFGLIAGFSIIGYFLIVFAYSMPRNKVQSNIAKDVEYYSQYHEWANHLWATHDDAYSDAYMLSAASGPNDNPLRSAALVLRYSPASETDSIFDELQEVYSSDDKNNLEEASYPRYWHGYLSYLVPLLCVLSPAEINVLNFGIQFILIIAIILLAYKKYGVKLATAIAIYIYALNPATTVMSFQYMPGFYLSIIPMIVIILAHDKLSKNGRYLLLFTFIGCSVNYLDLLSYPLVTLGAPLALTVYLDKPKNKLRESFFTIIMRSSFWVIGYAFTWAAKWAIASIVTGQNMFADALDAVVNRSTGGGYSRFEAISRNIHTMFNTPTIVLCILCVLVLLFLLWRKKIILAIKQNKAYIFLLAVIAAYPFVWYSVLVNHSWIHTFMTHRLLAITMFCSALCIAKLVTRPAKTINKKISK